MKKFLLTCLALILANTVIAQAAFEENLGNLGHVPTGKWTATYAGTTQLDGMKLVAAFERIDQELAIPQLVADQLQTLVPFAPVTKKAFRLTLVSIDQPNIRVSFPLISRTAMTNGQPTVTYLSELRQNDQFRFALLPQSDGTLKVHYQRVANESAEGEFVLEPLPQVL